MQRTPGNALHFLYLIDSILKNVGGVYVQVFGDAIVDTYTKAYEAEVDVLLYDELTAYEALVIVPLK